jgi:NAD-dependent deacetylase
MQERVNIGSVITNTVYSLYEKAGCKNVISINGTVEKNTCTSCGKVFDAEYVRAHRLIPHCDKCQVTLRPGFTLIGETIDNGLMSKALNEVEKSDVVLVIGSSLRDKVFKSLIKYYTGDSIIVINKEELFGDEIANYRLYGDINEIVGRLRDDIVKTVPVRDKEEADTEDTKERSDAETDTEKTTEETAEETADKKDN